MQVFQATQSPIVPFTFQYNRSHSYHQYQHNTGEYLFKNEEVSNERSGEILLITIDPRIEDPILKIERFGKSFVKENRKIERFQ